MSTPTSSSSSQPTHSLDRQVILEEDEYTEALSHIIARDFFPSLVHLETTNDYLDALQSKDPQLIQASVRRMEQLSTPTPHRSQPWETPLRTPYAMSSAEESLREPPAKRPRYDTDMSLDGFQARYTSEDNSSFTQILEDENRKRSERWSWAWDAQKRVEEQRGKMLEGRERLLIEGPVATGIREKFRIEAPTPAGLLTDGSASDDKRQDDGGEKGKEVALKKGEHTQLETEEPVDVMAPKKDTRAAGVDGWKFKTRNALMFPPDADESPYQPPVAKPVDVKGEPKAIKYGNTRLPEQDDTPERSISAPASPTQSRIDAAIAGTPYRPKTPTGDNFSLVPSVPSPTPSDLGPTAVRQLMTWGTLTATPRVLSRSDDPAESSSMPPPSTPFHIAEPSSRERISHKLSANAARSLRTKAGLLGGHGVARSPASNDAHARKNSMPPPSWTPRRAEAAGGLTPAARRLLDRTTMGTAATRRAEAMGKMAAWEGSSGTKRDKDLNGIRWTPTPSPATRRL